MQTPKENSICFFVILASRTQFNQPQSLVRWTGTYINNKKESFPLTFFEGLQYTTMVSFGKLSDPKAHKGKVEAEISHALACAEKVSVFDKNFSVRIIPNYSSISENFELSWKFQ